MGDIWTRAEPVSISGTQAVQLLKRAAAIVKKDVSACSYTLGQEIMLEYGSDIHFLGVSYDKAAAEEDRCKPFASRYMRYYLDEEYFPSIGELKVRARIHGVRLKSIRCGILVAGDYRRYL